MLLQDLYRDLSYGELSNLAMSNDGDGTIQEAQQPKIVRYTNEGLLALYSKFILLEKDLLIEQYEHITNYHLLKRFSQQGYDPESEDYPYIIDLNREPFSEDVLKILAVYDSCGYARPINDNERADSLFSPQAKILQVPNPVAGEALSVLYQARHPELLVSEPEGEIILPDVLKGALTAFVAYKVYSHMNTENSSAKAQEHYMIYENICTNVVEMDMVSTSTSTTNSRFEKNGWI